MLPQQHFAALYSRKLAWGILRCQFVAGYFWDRKRPSLDYRCGVLAVHVENGGAIGIAIATLDKAPSLSAPLSPADGRVVYSSPKPGPSAQGAEEVWRLTLILDALEPRGARQRWP